MDLRDHLIVKYREQIEIRYNWDFVKSNFNLPVDLTSDTILDIKNYFLIDLYPLAGKRAKLETSFKTLANFVKKPSKTWRLLGNLAIAIFKYGRLFPVALITGYRSLQAFLEAQEFEKSLATAAANKYKVPLSNEQFNKCVSFIPREKSEKFVADIVRLFASMTNDSLLTKTIKIVADVKIKMLKHPNVYSQDEVDGIALGLTILENGYNIFKDLNTNIKSEVIRIISANEKLYLDKVYAL